MTESGDRERIIALESQLAALDRVVNSAIAATDKEFDRVISEVQRQLLIVQDSQRRLVDGGDFSKLEARVEQIDRLLQEMRVAFVPRNEIQARFDALGVRQEQATSKIGEVINVLTAMRSELEGHQEEARVEADKQEKAIATQERKRSNTITALGVVVTLFAAIIAFLTYADSTKPPAPAPPTTTIVGHP